MSRLGHREYQSAGVLDSLLGWLFSLLVTSIVMRLAITMLLPLAPWIIAVVLLFIAGRLWLYRRTQWR